ncbi:MAG: hypothetical protein A2Z25_16960 [Planctomycetes bacterium RBG_16_55_9]|nr:MAG: hypothetical protein A2Z25_16960 [Planctomycetes bacterium RBG_16_55_9]
MFKNGRKSPFVVLYISLVFMDLVYAVGVPEGLEGAWDPAKYVGLDEIKPGMNAYCLTEYGRAGIEKFDMKVVDVVRNINPSSGPGSRDAILVEGTDPRFMHTGPVAGCSGSPVYIDGRLAGALAFTWIYAKDPLYGATPIEEMLRIGLGSGAGGPETGPGHVPMDIGIGFDFSSPLDLHEVDKKLQARLAGVGRNRGGMSYLPCPLITSGLPAGAAEQLKAFVEPLGLMLVAGGGAGAGAETTESEKTRLVPGACLAVPMVSGDITLSTYGTVTDVVDDKVYGFGHYLLGYGQIDMPMATAKVHTVVSNVASSFKLASVLETVGALTTDEATGIVGRIGAEAKTIPLTIQIDRYNDTQKRLYKCRLVSDRLLTPFYLRVAMAGAAFQLGDFPQEHTIGYKVAIDLKGGESVSFANVSSDLGLNELILESYGSVGLLMNNPYDRVDIESIACDIRILPKSSISHIWSVELSDAQVKAGRNVEIGVIVESILASKKRFRCTLEIPNDLPAGKYELTVCGPRDYERFLVKMAPHKFIAQSFPELVRALNDSLQISRGRLYFLLALPPRGVIVENAELPDLPDTKTLILQDSKRALQVLPYSHWIERSVETDTIMIDKSVLPITVER